MKNLVIVFGLCLSASAFAAESNSLANLSGCDQSPQVQRVCDNLQNNYPEIIKVRKSESLPYPVSVQAFTHYARGFKVNAEGRSVPVGCADSIMLLNSDGLTNEGWFNYESVCAGSEKLNQLPKIN